MRAGISLLNSSRSRSGIYPSPIPALPECPLPQGEGEKRSGTFPLPLRGGASVSSEARKGWGGGQAFRAKRERFGGGVKPRSSPKPRLISTLLALEPGLAAGLGQRPHPADI